MTDASDSSFGYDIRHIITVGPDLDLRSETLGPGFFSRTESLCYSLAPCGFLYHSETSFGFIVNHHSSAPNT